MNQDLSSAVASASGAQTATLSVVGPDQTSASCTVAINTQPASNSKAIESLFPVDATDNIAVLNTSRHLMTRRTLYDLSSGSVMEDLKFEYTKDASDHVVTKKVTLVSRKDYSWGNTDSYSAIYSYDSNGNLAKIQYPDNFNSYVNFSFDKNNRITSYARNNYGVLSSYPFYCFYNIACNPNGSLSAKLYSSISATYGYDSLGRVTTINSSHSDIYNKYSPNTDTFDWSKGTYDNFPAAFLYAGQTLDNIINRIDLAGADQGMYDSPLVMFPLFEKANTTRNGAIFDYTRTDASGFKMTYHGMLVKVVIPNWGTKYMVLYLGGNWSKSANGTTSLIQSFTSNYDANTQQIYTSYTDDRQYKTTYDAKTMNVLIQESSDLDSTRIRYVYQYEP